MESTLLMSTPAHSTETTAAAAGRIDVLIPVYNGAAWLVESIESIRAQSHRDLHIHVVDDGSTDDSAAILARLAAADDRIHLHRKRNGGIVDALNHGLRFCSAEWLARHDADDVAYPGRLAAQLDYLRGHADCVAVGGVARHIDAAGRPLGTVTQLRPPELADASWLPAREPYLMHPFLLARRAAVVAVGGYRQVRHAEDSDLYWRLAERGRLHNLSELLGDYRMHAGSITAASIANGRTMAVSSQRAAIAANRRRRSLPDLAVDASAGHDGSKVTALQALVDASSMDLFADERAAHRVAVAAKLLELTSYLPFELDADDCRFVGAAARCANGLPMPSGNRRELEGRLTRAAVRLTRAGRARDARHLLPGRLVPEFALRWLARAAMPAGLRRTLHTLAAPGRGRDAA